MTLFKAGDDVIVDFGGLDHQGEVISLRDRIAAVVRKADEVSCDESCNGPECCDWYVRVADVLICQLPELQPCPFCGLSHNRCDCLRTTNERT